MTSHSHLLISECAPQPEREVLGREYRDIQSLLTLPNPLLCSDVF